jgi:hypothetical protein
MHEGGWVGVKVCGQLLEQCSKSKQTGSSSRNCTTACQASGTIKATLLQVSSACGVALPCCTLFAYFSSCFQPVAQGNNSVRRGAYGCVHVPQFTPVAPAVVFCVQVDPPSSVSLQGRSWQLCPDCQQLVLCYVVCLRHHSTAGAAGSLGRSHLTSLVAQDETAN